MHAGVQQKCMSSQLALSLPNPISASACGDALPLKTWCDLLCAGALVWSPLLCAVALAVMQPTKAEIQQQQEDAVKQVGVGGERGRVGAEGRGVGAKRSSSSSSKQQQ